MAYNNLSTGLCGALLSLLFCMLLVNMTRNTFTLLFIISAILFLAGGIVFSRKVTHCALDARLQASMEEGNGLV